MENEGDQIIWINHAGYELRSAGIRFVHDPWMNGLAFADGWALVSNSRYAIPDFDGVDYIWFSHEHPDHFSPSILQAIPAEVRRGITVLFQRTRDRRVVDFCRKLGFAVQELPNGQRTRLRDGFFATCGVSGIDSWLFLETPEATYLNLNDVVDVEWPEVKARLSRPVDVLLTQFSYASWVGNPGDTARMARQADRKLKEMDRQVSIFQPRALIPFASYIWFCREENFHLNAGINRIDKVFERFRDRVETIILYPGDRYRPGQSFPSAGSITRYLEDWASRDRPLEIKDPAIPIGELEALSAAHQGRLRKANALWLLKPLQITKFIPTVSIYLKDIETGIRYSMFGGILEKGLTRSDCEIELSSSSFANILRNGYGFGTLLVNGRFLELQPDASLRLSRHFAISAQNEQGYGVPGIFLRRDYVGPHIHRRWRLLRKRLRAMIPAAATVRR